MKILIIRHGDPDYTIDSLTEKGKTEAAKKPAVRKSAPKKKSAKAAEKTGKQAK